MVVATLRLHLILIGLSIYKEEINKTVSKWRRPQVTAMVTRTEVTWQYDRLSSTENHIV